MKMTTLKSVAIAVGLASSAFGQATSPVVGYETLTYASGFNFLGLRLHEKPIASGDLEVVGASSVQDSDSDFSALVADVQYILEIEDGSGNVVELLGSAGDAAGNLSTNVDLAAAGVLAGSSYTLRPLATLAGVFGDPAGGANNTGLAASSAPGTADQVWVPNGSGGFEMYYINEFFGAAEWRSVDTDAAIVGGASSVPLSYLDSVIINATAAGSLVVSGDLKTAETSQALSTGFNFLGSVYPVGSTLASAYGAVVGGVNDTGLTASSAPGTADQVWVPDGSGGFSMYYVNEFFGTAEWRNVDTDTAIAGGPSSVTLTSGIILSATAAQNLGSSAPSFYAGL